MISKEKFDFIKQKYGLYVSWAVCGKQGKRPSKEDFRIDFFDKIKEI